MVIKNRTNNVHLPIQWYGRSTFLASSDLINFQSGSSIGAPIIDSVAEVTSWIELGDGCIAWEISDVRKKIEKSIDDKQAYIDSPPFFTSNNGQKVYVRLYLDGNRDRKYVAAYLHMDIPEQSPFKGTVRFTLIDQSKRGPCDNIAKDCHGSLVQIGDCIGCENFTDKNNLHGDGNRFIRDDKFILLVQLRPNGGRKFGNMLPGLLHAMTEN